MAANASTKVVLGARPPKQPKVGGITTPFTNRIAKVGGKR